MAAGVTCPGCGIMQMAQATCKSCGAALGAPAPPPRHPRDQIASVRQGPEVLRAMEYVPPHAWECGCGVTNAEGRKRCSGCGYRYADAMYHAREAEWYGFSPSLRENRKEFQETPWHFYLLFSSLFPFYLVVLVIYGLFKWIRPSRD